MIDQFKAGAGCLYRYTRLEACHQAEPVRVTLDQPISTREHLGLHRDGDPKVAGLARIDAAEMGRGNADDDEGRRFDHKFLSQHGRVAGEHPVPKRVADDGDRMGAGSVIFIGCERPADYRLDAKQGKEIDGDHLSLDGLAGGTWTCRVRV